MLASQKVARMDKIMQTEVEFENRFTPKKLVGHICGFFDNLKLIKELGTYTIRAHRNWAAGEWIEKGLDIPPPHVGETWLCNLHDVGPGIIGRRLIATPVEFLSWEFTRAHEGRKLLKQEVENG